MKKKIFAIFCVVCIVALSLTGCGDKDNTETTNNSEVSVSYNSEMYDTEEESTIAGYKDGIMNLSEYLTAYFKGTNGAGEIHFDLDDFNAKLDYAGVTDVDNPTEEQLAKMDELTKFFMGIKCEVSKTNGLSNGDEVTITVSYKSEYLEGLDLEIGKTSKTFVVNGLN